MGVTAAIVGAGMSGAACARTLVGQGWTVAMFDKGRGVGGRLAQRRTAHGTFDHGAQYVTARDPAFRDAVDGWAHAGIMAPWPAVPGNAVAWVGIPAMNAPVKALLDGLAIHSACRIERVERTGDGWRLTAEEGMAYGPFHRLVLAIPAPQALSLLATAGIVVPGLAEVVIAPCWSGLLTFAEPLDSARDIVRPDAGPLAWAARQGGVPGRDGAASWVVHAAPDWSREHLELPPEAVAPQLMAMLAAALGTALPPLLEGAAHRWRYAQVERPFGSACFSDATADLGLCGDWCIGPRVEAAWLSGTALARQLIADRNP